MGWLMKPVLLNFFPKKQGFILVAICSLLIVFPLHAIAVNSHTIVCSGGQNGKKLIAVNYGNSGGKVCRTTYDAGDGQLKQIAWAQSSTQFCTGVAFRLMTKLTNAGLSCNSDVPLTKAHLQTAQLKTYRKIKNYKPKKKLPTQYADEAFLESIKK